MESFWVTTQSRTKDTWNGTLWVSSSIDCSITSPSNKCWKFQFKITMILSESSVSIWPRTTTKKFVLSPSHYLFCKWTNWSNCINNKENTWNWHWWTITILKNLLAWSIATCLNSHNSSNTSIRMSTWYCWTKKSQREAITTIRTRAPTCLIT